MKEKEADGCPKKQSLLFMGFKEASGHLELVTRLLLALSATEYKAGLF